MAVADNESDFAGRWSEVAGSVESLCRRLVHGPERAGEVAQRTAIRAWRAFKHFKGDSSFRTWVLAIAHNEANRLLSQEFDDNRVRLNDEPSLPDHRLQSSDSGSTFAGALALAARRATADGMLTHCESLVVQARLSDSHASWREIGQGLSLTANACAQTHCRAVCKLRVYLFTHYPALVGGAREISRAYRLACEDTATPLSPLEREVFEHIVMHARSNYRRRGWRETLRSACSKVVRHLAL